MTLLAALGACGDDTEDDHDHDDSDGSTTESAPDAAPGDDEKDAAVDSGPDLSHASEGCTDGTAEPGDEDATLAHDGEDRSYILHVPSSYDGKKPMPLVLNMHGYLSNYMEQVGFSGMSEVADEEGFIVAYPNGAGVPAAWNGGTCCAFAAPEQDDVGFISALIDEIGEQACIDTSRVYATGYSNGGFLSHRLACELSDRIAAIASVAGVLGIPEEECEPGRAVPVLAIHGDADGTVPIAGGSPAGWELLNPDTDPPVFASEDDSVGFWREENGCSDTTTPGFSQGDTMCVSYDGCKDGSEVIRCTIEGGGHTWPGGDSEALLGEAAGLKISDLVGKTSTDYDGSAEIWSFFERHPLQ